MRVVMTEFVTRLKIWQACKGLVFLNIWLFLSNHMKYAMETNKDNLKSESSFLLTVHMYFKPFQDQVAHSSKR